MLRLRQTVTLAKLPPCVKNSGSELVTAMALRCMYTGEVRGLAAAEPARQLAAQLRRSWRGGDDWAHTPALLRVTALLINTPGQPRGTEGAVGVLSSLGAGDLVWKLCTWNDGEGGKPGLG